MPSALSNTLYKCADCGNVEDFEGRDVVACRCGQFHWEQMRIVTVCDFCGWQGVQWTFPARSFEIPTPGPTQGSEGDWAACEKCKELVENHDRIGLARRATEASIERQPELRGLTAQVYASVADLHRQFFAHRTGPPYREESR